LQRCKAAIRIAEKHQDIHLLAIANSAAADLGPITKRAVMSQMIQSVDNAVPLVGLVTVAPYNQNWFRFM